MIHSFPPLSSPDAEILILGTMPGDKSLQLNQYYAHRGNQFWQIMFDCFGQSYSNNYEMKKKLLTDHRIALWDVLASCEREGSSDSSIHKEIPNDIAKFLESHPGVKSILCNSKKAFDLYWKYNESITIDCYCLPSTSPRNKTMSEITILNRWKEHIDPLLFSKH